MLSMDAWRTKEGLEDNHNVLANPRADTIGGQRQETQSSSISGTSSGFEQLLISTSRTITEINVPCHDLRFKTQAKDLTGQGNVLIHNMIKPTAVNARPRHEGSNTNNSQTKIVIDKLLELPLLLHINDGKDGTANHEAKGLSDLEAARGHLGEEQLKEQESVLTTQIGKVLNPGCGEIGDAEGDGHQNRQDGDLGDRLLDLAGVQQVNDEWVNDSRPTDGIQGRRGVDQVDIGKENGPSVQELIFKLCERKNNIFKKAEKDAEDDLVDEVGPDLLPLLLLADIDHRERGCHREDECENGSEQSKNDERIDEDGEQPRGNLWEEGVEDAAIVFGKVLGDAVDNEHNKDATALCHINTRQSWHSELLLEW